MQRVKEMSKVWELCKGTCQISVTIICFSSNRKKRATTNGQVQIEIPNAK